LDADVLMSAIVAQFFQESNAIPHHGFFSDFYKGYRKFEQHSLSYLNSVQWNFQNPEGARAQWSQCPLLA
jgi:hypothetical protein